MGSAVMEEDEGAFRWIFFFFLCGGRLRVVEKFFYLFLDPLPLCMHGLL